jgi:hypothetical protein
MKYRTDQDYLLQQQYCDASNLQARIALHQRFSTNSQGLPRWFLEQLQIPENGRVLELGCGPGGYGPEVAEMKPRDGKCGQSNDVDRRVLARASKLST